MTNSSDREQQRVAHLVLGHNRPRDERAAAGQRRKRGRRTVARPAPVPVELAGGVEEWVALRERWSHKQGTPETHEHAEQERQRPGSLARLYATAAIDADQLAAAQQIAEAHRAIAASVSVRTASLETRVDGGLRDHGGERLSAVCAEFAYTWWRASVVGPIAALLAIIVDDVPLTVAASRHSTSTRRLRGQLVAALDLWWTGRGMTKRAATTATFAPYPCGQ